MSGPPDTRAPIPDQSPEGTGGGAFRCQIKQLWANTINQGSKASMQCTTLNFNSIEINYANLEIVPATVGHADIGFVRWQSRLESARMHSRVFPSRSKS